MIILGCFGGTTIYGSHPYLSIEIPDDSGGIWLEKMVWDMFFSNENMHVPIFAQVWSCLGVCVCVYIYFCNLQVELDET